MQEPILLAKVLAPTIMVRGLRVVQCTHSPGLKIRNFLVERFTLLLPATLGACELGLGSLCSGTAFPDGSLTLLQAFLELVCGLKGFSMSNDLLRVTLFRGLIPT